MRRSVAIAVLLGVAGAGAAWAALRPGAAARPTSAAPAVDPAVASAVALADRSIASDADALDAARILEKDVRERPAVAGDLARLLPTLRSRPLAFRVALMLGGHLADPKVHGALIEDLERGGGSAREMAASSFYGVRGDPEAAAALARGFRDRAADARVRAAQGFSLVRMMDDLPASERAAVRAEARAVVADAKADAALRSEAVGLLDVAGQDRPLARDLLAKDPERPVALSAARVLLRSGEDERAVFPSLERFASSAKDADLAARSLHAMLEGDRP